MLGEFELGWRLLPEHEFVAVTGSNGKTTTVELIGHIHREAGLPVIVAGNVGTALTSLPGTLAPGTTVVCEASSFQLEDTEAFAPEAAVLLNLAEDHLDRHGTFEAYRAAKLEIFARQPNEAVAVAPLGLGIEDLGGCARRVCFGAGPGAELAERAGQLWWDEQPLLAVDEIGLRGAHNLQNAMAAAAVCLARGVDPRRGRGRPAHASAGLAHRLEEVATVDGVLYVNDSKATNVASALVGIDSFPGGVHVDPRRPQQGRRLRRSSSPPVAERCRAAYLIGETAAELREALAPGRRRRCTTAATSSTPSRAAAPRGAPGRRRPALARLPVVRPVRDLRGARRPLPGARAGRSTELDMNPAPRREASGAACRMQV